MQQTITTTIRTMTTEKNILTRNIRSKKMLYVEKNTCTKSQTEKRKHPKKRVEKDGPLSNVLLEAVAINFISFCIRLQKQ